MSNDSNIPKGVRSWRIDAVLIPLLAALVVLAVSWLYVGTLSDPFKYPHYAQMVMIYPAVFFAAGHGMGTADVEGIPGLAEFIYRESDAFDISNIPADLVIEPLHSPLALSALYFLYAIGWMWRLFGVSETTLILYAALLRALCAPLLYALFRFGLGKLLSFIATMVVCLSPAMLTMGISLRDWGTAPFIFGFLLLAAHLVVHPISRGRLLTLSILLGALLGVGMGFRQDFLVILPLVAVMLCLFVRVDAPRPFFWRAVALLLFCLVFLPVSRPILRGSALEGDQETSVNTIFRGMSHTLETEMQFGESSLELLPHSFSGEAANYAVINTYARRMGNHESMVNTYSAEYRRSMGEKSGHLLVDPYLFYNGLVYAEMGRLVLRDSVRFFLADFVARAWRSTVAVFQGPMYYSNRILASAELRPPWMNALFQVQARLARHMERYTLLYVAVVLLVLAARDFRLALFAAGVFLWFAGYPSLKFEYRHAFYLIFIPVWAMAICIEQPIRWLWARYHGDTIWARKVVGIGIAKSLALAVMVAVIYVVPLSGLRAWQAFHVVGLADRLSDASREPVPLSLTSENGRVYLYPREPLPGLAHADDLPPGETAWEYVALVFDTHGFNIPVTIHYDESRLLNDFTQTIPLHDAADGRTGTVTLFCPIYELDTTYSMEMLPDFLRTYPAIAAQIDDPRPVSEQDWWRRGRFLGISFPEQYLGLFRGFYTVTDIDDIRILPLFQVPEDRRFLRPYKTGPWERRLRAWVAAQCGREPEHQPPPVNNDCWVLDEGLLYHPPSPIFSRPLLQEASAEAYIATWRDRVAYLPELADAAAMDLANAGTQWFRDGRLEDAGAAYREACSLAPENALYWVRKGQLLERDGESRRALDAYGHALRLQSFLPATADSIDALFEATGEREAQRAFWSEVFRTHPDSWFVGMRLGTLLEEGGEYAAAAGAYLLVHEQHPEHPDTRLALARCWGRTGRAAEAADLVADTVDIHPEYWALALAHLEALGEYLNAERDPAGAEAVYSKLAVLDPKNPVWWVHLGDAQVQNRKPDNGLRSYQRALELADEAEEALVSQIRERIQRAGAPVVEE